MRCLVDNGPDLSWCVRYGDQWVTTRDVLWPLGKKGSPHVVKIPRGFVFDSSVPRYARWWLSPDDPHFLLAACVHDWLIAQGYGRAFADSQWHDAARSVAAPVCKRRIAYFLMTTRAGMLGKWG